MNVVSGDRQANANDVCVALQYRLQARKQILIHFIFGDYQISKQNERNKRGRSPKKA
jgi:hypothetical protein